MASNTDRQNYQSPLRDFSKKMNKPKNLTYWTVGMVYNFKKGQHQTKVSH